MEQMYDNVEDYSNNAKRLPVVFCLDVSPSMNSNNRIISLNNVIKKFLEYFSQQTDTRIHNSLDIAMVTFASDVTVAHEFATLHYYINTFVQQNKTIAITENGGTNLGGGILKSFELLDSRRIEYSRAALQYFVPYLIIVTDGNPDTVDNQFIDAQQKVQYCSDAKIKRNLVFTLPIGVGTNIYPDHLEKLNVLGTGNIFITDREIASGMLDDIFKVVSSSITQSIMHQDTALDQKERLAKSIIESLTSRYRTLPNTPDRL